MSKNKLSFFKADIKDLTDPITFTIAPRDLDVWGSRPPCPCLRTQFSWPGPSDSAPEMPQQAQSPAPYIYGFFQCTQIMSCPVSDCQWEGSGSVFFNQQFLAHTDKIWSLLFSSLNNHISFSLDMRCFCYLIILMALKSGLKEWVYEVVISFSIYSEVLHAKSPMKITWITSILMSNFNSVLRPKTA